MSKAYEIIKAFYSGVPLINHIDEGLIILTSLGADDVTKDAFCIHPVLQSDENFRINKSSSFLNKISAEAVILCMEYRRVANSYLSSDCINKFVGISCEAIKQMLIADKVQNYKDFMQYHFKTHEHSARLYVYFHQWFSILGIDYDNYRSLLIK